MSSSIIWYLKEFVRAEWLSKFFFVRTAPLATPPHFRGYPTLTGKECTHCLLCMMICPTGGAIEVLRAGEGWEPRVYPGHCIRCGLCVEICPEDVLASGRVLETVKRDDTYYLPVYRITIDRTRCMRCGNCSVACPINKAEDPQLSATGTALSDEVIMRIRDGEMRVIHEEKCTGCKTCEEACPNQAIRVARMVEAVQLEGYQR
ncbi:MAG: 4Fe-4S dicluster domain-containing protein [Methanomicrobiales archaeon]|nr:4Fe-4S dicluster domain-containing protein [Methanomicrobiales archaeon]